MIKIKYDSVFDIIGPVMVGPSSSHTAGAARIGKIAYKLFSGIPEKVIITFYGSFAKTYKGHGSDVAIVAGLLGMEPFDNNLKKSLEIAIEKGMRIEFLTSEKVMAHPNTIHLKLMSKDKAEATLIGESIGGGKTNIIEINGFKTELSGSQPTLLIFHKDKFGTIAQITQVFSNSRINIAQMNVARNLKGEQALMTIEADQPILDKLVDSILEIEAVDSVIII